MTPVLLAEVVHPHALLAAVALGLRIEAPFFTDRAPGGVGELTRPDPVDGDAPARG